MALVALAILLATTVGFATQRGSICTVMAVKYMVTRGDPRRFLALLACSIWSLATLIITYLLGAHSFDHHYTYSPGVLAALGGALFGAGSIANGACAFGSIARLGGGDLAFVATPVGFVIGAALISQIAPIPDGLPVNDVIPENVFPIAGIIVGAFIAFSAYHALRIVKNFKGAIRVITAKRWRPFFAVAVIGVLNTFLAVVVVHWPYTSLLIDFASEGYSDQGVLKLILAIFLLGGAVAGAATAGRFSISIPGVGAFIKKIPAGMIMGAGAFLIPGGNDALVLSGLPLLQPYAFIAYAAMAVTMAGLIYFMMNPRRISA